MIILCPNSVTTYFLCLAKSILSLETSNIQFLGLILLGWKMDIFGWKIRRGGKYWQNYIWSYITCIVFVPLLSYPLPTLYFHLSKHNFWLNGLKSSKKVIIHIDLSRAHTTSVNRKCFRTHDLGRCGNGVKLRMHFASCFFCPIASWRVFFLQSLRPWKLTQYLTLDQLIVPNCVYLQIDVELLAIKQSPFGYVQSLEAFSSYIYFLSLFSYLNYWADRPWRL